MSTLPLGPEARDILASAGIDPVTMGPTDMVRQVAPDTGPTKKKKGFFSRLGDILLDTPGTLYSEESVPLGGNPEIKQTVRKPTKFGRVAGAIASLVDGGIAGASQQNVAGGGPTDFFRAMSAGIGQKQQRDQLAQQNSDRGRAQGIQDYQLKRQGEADDRADKRIDEAARHNRELEAGRQRESTIRAEKDADKNFLDATKDGRYKTIAPDLSDYLEGKTPDFKLPDGFDRGRYEKIGGRWVERQDQTSKDTQARSKLVATMADKGMKPGPVPDTWVPMSEDELSTYRRSQIDKNKATTDATKAKIDLGKRALDIRAKMAAIALMNAGTAQGRLQIARDQFNFDYRGLDQSGNPVLVDAEGRTVIPKIASATGSKVPASMQTKIAQANTIVNVGEELKKMVRDVAESGQIGPVAGRIAGVEVEAGTADSAVKALVTEIKNYASLLPAVHGARGVTAMRQFEDTIGILGQNPENLIAAIDRVQAMSRQIVKDNQTVYKPLSERNATPPPNNGRQEVKMSDGSAGYVMTKPDGTKVKVPAADVGKAEAKGYK